MKLKTLAALCKREAVFRLYDRVNEEGQLLEQWLGTSSAIYPLTGIPYLREQNLVVLFDITEKQRESIVFIHEQAPDFLNLDDIDTDEILMDREKSTLGYGGWQIRPMFGRGGISFIDTELLAPLADVADMLELYERCTGDGGPYFVAKTGLMIAGVIMPLDIIDKAFVENLEKLAGQSRAALDRNMQEE